MMKKLLGILIGLLLFTFTYSQEYADKEFYLIDSLNLSSIEEEELLLIDSLLNIYHSNEPDTTRLFALNDLCIELWTPYISERYLIYCSKIAQEFYDNANLESKEKKKYGIVLANSFGGRAYFCLSRGEKEKALELYQKTLDIFLLINDEVGIGNSYISIGYYHYQNGNIKNAIENYYLAIELLEDKKERYGLAYVYTHLGSMYKDIEDYEESFNYYEKAIKEGLEVNDFSIVGTAYASIGVLSIDKGDKFESKSFIDSAYYYVEKGKNPHELLLVLEAYGDYYFSFNSDSLIELGKISDSIITISLREDIPSRLSNGYYYKAYQLLQTKKYHQSLDFAHKSYAIAEEIGDLELIKNSSGVLYKTYTTLGDFENALYFNIIYNNTNIDIVGDDKKKNVIKNQLNYEYQKQKEIDDLKSQQSIDIAEEKAQRNLSYLIAAIAIAILIAVIGAFLLYRAKQKKEQELLAVTLTERTKQFDLEKDVLVSKLKALRSQMNPHFIFNLLNSIQHLVLKGDIENSYNFINQFAGLVRSTLDYSDKDKILLSEEMELLQVYLQLEKLRFNEEFEYQIIEKNTELDVSIPPMLIQPFIENALVHGLLHKKGLRKLIITIEVGEVVVCTVEDNGVGRVKAKEIRERQRGNHKSFSTAAIEKRFAILSDYYKEELGYTYYDLNDEEDMVTRVVLRIPYDKIKN